MPMAARLCVHVAFLVSRLRPGQIEQLLGLVGRGARHSTPDEALNAYQSIASSDNRCAGDYCLQRSIAIVLLCRLGGHFPVWKVGAQLNPFFAHAWVESCGVPIGETISFDRMRVLLRAGST